MQVYRFIRSVAVGFFVLLGWCATGAIAAPSYRLIELPFIGPPDDPFNDTSATAINRVGDTAVNFYGAFGSSALHCNRLSCVTVPPLYVPHWPAVSAGGINDAGLVLATSADLSLSTHALVFDGTTNTRIYGLPDDLCGGCFNDSYGRGINNRGQVVGSAMGSDGRERAFIWQAGNLQELGTLGGSRSTGTAINDHGDVVGYASTASGATHAFVYRRGRMTDLGTLGADWAEAYGINGARQVVGCSGLPDGQTRPFTYSNGQMSALPSLGGPTGCATGINQGGFIVGTATTPAQEEHGFVHDGARTWDLNDRISASARAKWLIIGASAINHRGMIAATGMNRQNGVVRALLLWPRPESTTQQ
ncbi:hypothetical protein AACH06_24190 [Ideonella sp. DXS29W]|uniref:HAF repeat-containing protein n=1 Tax=Ideonella lacteola TaxID=2984193 RepID=A0ABU9BVE4_9BURK